MRLALQEFLPVRIVFTADTPGLHCVDLRVRGEVRPWSVFFAVQPTDAAWAQLLE
jgi:hypothetical protein